jgi:hypothetical protein
MSEEEYLDFLKKAPEDHYSNDFKMFLINNNNVRFINQDWLVIENKKYHTEENDWLTAFYVGSYMREGDDWYGLGKLQNLQFTFKESHDREWRIKAPSKRTIKLFHVHLIKKV